MTKDICLSPNGTAYHNSVQYLLHNQQEKELDDRSHAIETCSCPRPPWGSLEAPVCAVDYFYGSKEDGTLFVTPPPGLYCHSKNNFGYGHICACENRRQVFQKFGI